MGLDKAGADQPAAGIVGLAIAVEVRRQGGDSPVLDADIDGAGRRCGAGAAGEAGIAQDQLHGTPDFRLRAR